MRAPAGEPGRGAARSTAPEWRSGAGGDERGAPYGERAYGHTRRAPAHAGRVTGGAYRAGTALCAMASAYQRALDFGVRRWEAKSTWTMPNRLL
ncbi:hypothetical protein GCM10019016_036480 [Streptomyces prasinosporus]|uniref:Uncharacterized protein n=1 Tax=Streptomyces prasinosporus TaxID=68256 RepID=A0ABP6TNG2_9ACTN